MGERSKFTPAETSSVPFWGGWDSSDKPPLAAVSKADLFQYAYVVIVENAFDARSQLMYPAYRGTTQGYDVVAYIMMMCYESTPLGV